MCKGWMGGHYSCLYVYMHCMVCVCDLQVQQLVDSMSHCMPARGRRRKRRREEESGRGARRRVGEEGVGWRRVKESGGG